MFDKNSALILIDIQKGFDEPVWGKRNNLQAEEHMEALLQAWRMAILPIFHIQHNSTRKDSPLHPSYAGNQIKTLVSPLKVELLITKTVNSAFIRTDLEKQLGKRKIDTVVIVGLTTDHCVSTTARMASNLEFKTFVVSDATATFERKGYNGKYYSAQEMHEMALVSLENEFAAIIDTSSILHSFKTHVRP
jgi:nicotinamidase-related amidase